MDFGWIYEPKEAWCEVLHYMGPQSGDVVRDFSFITRLVSNYKK